MFRSSTCFGVFEDLSPYHSVFNPFLFVLSLQNAFYLSLVRPSSSFLLLYRFIHPLVKTCLEKHQLLLEDTQLFQMKTKQLFIYIRE